MDENPKKRFMIFGSFSGSNAGDMAILHTLVTQLEEDFPGSRFYVPTNVPSYFQKAFEYFGSFDIKPVSMRIRHLSYGFLSFQVLRRVKRCDAVFTTANMFFDWRLLNPWNNFLLTLLPILLFYRLFNGKALVIASSVSVNPPTYGLGKHIMRKVLELHDFVFVRDTNSARIIRILGGKIKYQGCYPDICVGQKFMPNDAANIPKLEKRGRRIIGFNLSSYFTGELLKSSEENFTGWLRFFSLIIKELKKSPNTEVIFITTSSTNEDLAKEISKRAGYTLEIFGPSRYFHPDLYSLISKLDVYVTMRMHGAIFALNAGVPCIGLCLTQKLRNFYTDFGLDEFRVDISPRDYNLGKTIGRFLKAINYAADLSTEKRENFNLKMAEKGELREKMFEVIKKCINENS